MTRLATMAVLACLASFAAVPAPAATVQQARYLMGTLCTVVVEAPDSATGRAATEAALDEIARLELVMSSWRDDSELARFNAVNLGAPYPVECSNDLHAVLDSAAVLARETGGAFDPTIEPLVAVWDLRGHGRVPDAGARERARALVDWHQLWIDPASRRARLGRRGMAVDLGGIGKGFALDRAAKVLARAGARRALLNFGGELLAIGGWDVQVAHPGDRLRSAARVRVANAAVSTSAQSEHGVEVGGRWYGHILDPATGMPIARTGSVTVVAASGTRADALSTALLVMGRGRAGSFAHAHPEIGVLWLEPSGRGVRAWRWNLNNVEVVADAAPSLMR